MIVVRMLPKGKNGIQQPWNLVFILATGGYSDSGIDRTKKDKPSSSSINLHENIKFY